MQKVWVGWRETLCFPEWDVVTTAKVDTGAQTSAIHAEQLSFYQKDEEEWVRFLVFNGVGKKKQLTSCSAKVVGMKKVKSSNGQTSERVTVSTQVGLGERTWPILLTLTKRLNMRYPMLLGRELLDRVAVVDTSQEFLTGSPLK